MSREPAQRRGVIIVVGVGSAFLGAYLAALGWGGWSPLLAHPARAATVALGFVFTALALASPINFSSGDVQDKRDRRLLVPLAAASVVLLWLVPYLDRRDRLTLDGDAVRYLGLTALVVGGVLRIWPMFVLGRRFSGLVAIQPDHTLVTDGLYGTIRHPSYLGGMIAILGWALVFRSGVGLAAVAIGIVPLVARIDAEEALLSGHFGSAYDAYRKRTWRLIPHVY